MYESSWYGQKLALKPRDVEKPSNVLFRRFPLRSEQIT